MWWIPFKTNKIASYINSMQIVKYRNCVFISHLFFCVPKGALCVMEGVESIEYPINLLHACVAKAIS